MGCRFHFLRSPNDVKLVSMKKTSKNAKHFYSDCNFEVGLTGFDEERRLNAHSFTTSPAAMVTAEAAIKEAERKVRDAIMREAIARNASASAAKAQVSAEAEVFVLRADASRLRDELRSAEDALQRASSERHASEATARSVAAENDTLRAEYANARREIDELNAVLRARSQDITQLGGVIISVYRGETDPNDLRDVAEGIAHVIGGSGTPPAVRGSGPVTRGSRGDERIRRSDQARASRRFSRLSSYSTRTCLVPLASLLHRPPRHRALGAQRLRALADRAYARKGARGDDDDRVSVDTRRRRRAARRLKKKRDFARTKVRDETGRKRNG